MNKQDFVDLIANKVGITKREAKESIDTLFEGITGALKKKKKVTFVGFGTFSTRKRKKRKGRNPRTGATITIKARRVPKFRAGKALKESIK